MKVLGTSIEIKLRANLEKTILESFLGVMEKNGIQQPATGAIPPYPAIPYPPPGYEVVQKTSTPPPAQWMTAPSSHHLTPAVNSPAMAVYSRLLVAQDIINHSIDYILTLIDEEKKNE